MQKHSLKLKTITAQETLTVRHPILREGKPISSCVFNGDTLDTTFHIGGFHKDNLIAVATFVKNPQQNYNFKKAYQLRGMAVLQNYQSKGFGKILLNFGISTLIEMKISTLWMNARENAIPFYKKLGFATIGNVFDIPEVGNHYIMYKELKTIL